MKTRIITCFAMFCGILLSQAQYNGWSFSANGGAPTGDGADFTTVNVGVDANFLTAVTPTLDLGGSIGYGRFFGKELETPFGTVEVEDYGYIPVAAAARFYATEKLFAGLQGGYAVSTETDVEGGFLYRIKGGYKITDVIDLFAMFQSITNDGDSLSALGAGLSVNL